MLVNARLVNARWFVVFLVLGAFLSTLPLYAEELRVDTEILVGEGQPPIAEYLTIFSNGRVYDFMLAPQNEITIYDQLRGKFDLIDTKKQLRTTITTEELRSFISKVKNFALREGKVSLVAPELEISFNETEHLLECKGTPVTYTVQGERARTAKIATDYREFADWSIQLSSMRQHTLPPFARLVVNGHLADRGLLPKQVTRQVVVGGLLRKKTQLTRSLHTLSGKLSSKDRQRIEEAGAFLSGEFREVSLPEYLREVDLAARPTNQKAG